MQVNIGMGERKIVYYNVDKLPQIDQMLMRIADAYKAMLQFQYPAIEQLYKGWTMVFSSERIEVDGIEVGISRRKIGVYSGMCAYQRQIAKEMFRLTGMPVVLDQDVGKIVIGLGGYEARTQGYVLLKDALLALPCALV